MANLEMRGNLANETDEMNFCLETKILNRIDLSFPRINEYISNDIANGGKINKIHLATMVWFGFLFNGISAFVGYLMPNLFS